MHVAILEVVYDSALAGILCENPVASDQYNIHLRFFSLSISIIQCIRSYKRIHSYKL